MVSLSQETVETAVTTMAESAAQTVESGLSESACELRRREKSQLKSAQMVEPRSEIEQRRIAAATEYYMTKGSAGALSIRALAWKHGLVHHKEVASKVKMNHMEEGFALAREFAEEACEIASTEQEKA